MRVACIASMMLLGLGIALTTEAATRSTKPNLVFILADDLGFADVGFHSANVPTPNIDRLAREGVEFTNHYVAPVCSPTRSALLTGRFWSRFDVTAPQNERALPWDTVTLPRALKTVGYDTCITGKWHLGSKAEWGPRQYGFDHSYGSLAGGVGPWNHRYKKGEYSVTWHRDDKLIEEKGHVTDLITDEAVGWIKSRGEAPFFLYVPFTAVHLPIREPDEYLKRVPDAITGDVPRHYAACIMHLDASVGRIVEALESSGKRERTMLVFTSDNGGTTSENNDTKYPEDDYPSGRIPGNNKPLRGEKAQVYDGGIHVACVASWPEKIGPGKLKPSKIDTPVHIVDWMPTFCHLAGFESQQNLKWDGSDLAPLFDGGTLNDRTLYWVAPGWRARAVRVGPWKLIVDGKDAAKQKVELYDLSTDPYETKDLAGDKPEKVEQMQAAMDKVAQRDKDAVASD
jgi:arylsulfatase I/J